MLKKRGGGPEKNVPLQCWWEVKKILVRSKKTGGGKKKVWGGHEIKSPKKKPHRPCCKLWWGFKRPRKQTVNHGFYLLQN